MNDLHVAARAALTAHDTLVQTRESEPPTDEDGLPVHAAAWVRWRDTINKPAYESWDAAMNELAERLGEPVSRHPHNFRPMCERILGEAAAMREP